MRNPIALVVLSLAAIALGVYTARGLPAQEQTANYAVLVSFEMSGQQSFEEALGVVTEWGNLMRGLGVDARAFIHEWGPSNSFYLLIETDDWNEIGTLFDRMGEASPELMTRPFGFAGHSDLIMRELPLD